MCNPTPQRSAPHPPRKRHTARDKQHGSQRVKQDALHQQILVRGSSTHAARGTSTHWSATEVKSCEQAGGLKGARGEGEGGEGGGGKPGDNDIFLQGG